MPECEEIMLPIRGKAGTLLSLIGFTDSETGLCNGHPADEAASELLHRKPILSFEMIKFSADIQLEVRPHI